MRARAKRLPRLWCALQGLLPLGAVRAVQRGELAWAAVASSPLTASAEQSGGRAERGNPTGGSLLSGAVEERNHAHEFRSR
jgi:hypothetical protein